MNTAEAENQQQIAALQERLKLQELIADISAMLVNLPASEVDAQIEHGLKRIVEFLGIDRSGFGEFSEDLKELRGTYSFQKQGIEAAPMAVLTDLFPIYAARIHRGEVFMMERPEDLPAEATAEKAYCQQSGLKSQLTIPVAIGGSLHCGIGFAAFHAYRSWPPELVEQLKRVAEIFGHAIFRKRAEEKLQKSHCEIKELKDRLQLEADYLREEIKVTHRHGDIVGQSEAIQRVLRQVEQVAPTDSAVLIQGETGAGKEIIARAIHDSSSRRSRVMVIVNCASLPASLIESELFGREKGAYTGAMTRQIGRFELADGSTIFLDEVGELPLELQAKLLRVLQAGEFERLGNPKTIQVNTRVIAATNRNLAEEVKKGQFREDLYYRLHVFPIEVPPLRERLADIPELVWTFVDEYGKRMGKKIQKIPKRTMEDLQRYSWPGNVRELRNVIERAIIISTDDILRIQIQIPKEATGTTLLTLAEMEAKHIKEVLEKTHGRIRGEDGTAAILGLNPSTLYSKMEKLGIRYKHENIGLSTQRRYTDLFHPPQDSS